MNPNSWIRPRWVNFGLLASLAGPMVASCGYHFVGESSLLPKNARTVYVETFVNRSRDIGMDKELTTALRSEFYRRGPLKNVEQAELADVIITGVIRPIETNVASVNGADEALQYSSVMIVDVTLRQREPNVILWRGDGIRLSELYAGSRAAVVTTSSDFRSGTLNPIDLRRLTDIQLTEAQRKDARDQLIERFARELHQRIMEMF